MAKRNWLRFQHPSAAGALDPGSLEKPERARLSDPIETASKSLDRQRSQRIRVHKHRPAFGTSLTVNDEGLG